MFCNGGKKKRGGKNDFQNVLSFTDSKMPLNRKSGSEIFIQIPKISPPKLTYDVFAYILSAIRATTDSLVTKGFMRTK